MQLEARIARLEAIEEIRRLKHENYCLAIDRGVCKREPQAFSPLVDRLADDVDVCFTGIGRMQGKAGAAAFFTEGVPSMLSWCQHRVSNPIIEIGAGGDTASGHWYVFCPALGTEQSLAGKGPVVIIGRYIETYARRDGRWLWTKLHAELDVMESASTFWSMAHWAE